MVRRCGKRQVVCLMVLCLTAGALACSAPVRGKTSSETGKGTSAQGEVVSPLVTHSDRADLLASVNSIDIALPTVTSSGAVVSVSPELAQEVIERSARETMTLNVREKRNTKPPSARRSGAEAADAILNTELLRFEDRQGSAVGGDPAIVSFRMSLQAVPSGREIWGAQYFYRQEAVSENLLRIKERLGPAGLGAGWRSAQDIFQRGVRDALQDFNNRREQRFLVTNR